MGQFWTLLTHLYALAGPVMMLLYPLYASVHAMETATKVDDEQWLAYWILYSFLTLMEMVLEPVLTWIPIWYELKLVFVGWLVLPQLRGAAFIYNKFVREKLMNSTHFNTTDEDKVAKVKIKMMISHHSIPRKRTGLILSSSSHLKKKSEARGLVVVSIYYSTIQGFKALSKGLKEKMKKTVIV